MNIRKLEWGLLALLLIMVFWIWSLLGDVHDTEMGYRLEHARVVNLLDLSNFLDTVQIEKDSLPNRSQENQWLYVDLDRHVVLVGLPSLGGYRCDYRCISCARLREERLEKQKL